MGSFQIIEQGGEDSAEKREMLERIKSEVELAKLDGSPATLAVVGVESLHIIRDLYGNDLTHEILRTVSGLFESAERGGSTCGWIEDSRIVLLFSRCDLEKATSLSELVISRVRDVEMRAGKHRLKLEPNIGLAHTEHDLDYSFEALLQVAEEGAEIASSSDGGTVVHTELYEIVEPKALPRKKRPKVAAPAPGAANAPAAPQTPSVLGTPGHSQTPGAPVTYGSPVANEPAASASAAPTIQETLASNLAEGRVHDKMLEHMLREMFTIYGGQEAATGELREKVIGAVRRWSEQSRDTLSRELHEQQEVELDLLKRRLAKMAYRVEETEGQLEALRGEERETDGIESAFRVVQGLDGQDVDYKLKSSMMREILQANLELMRQIN